MEIDHGGRTAVVTGGAGGIGTAIANRLADSGAEVVLLDVAEDVERTAAAVADDHGVRTGAYRADVADWAAVAAAIEDAAAEFGPPEILVNNAAITDNVATVREMSPEEFRREIAVNLSGAYNCTKACLERMDGFGRIVNVSSGTGHLGGYGQAAYASSKAGLLGLTKTVALEGAREGITCNAVLPGLVETAASDAIREDMLDRMLGTIPTRRRADPEEIANAIDFLAAEQASYVNGAELNVDAGQRLFTF